ncbi:MAG TPA: hypothetical protein VFK38_11580 [Candidatus Limnocylindrales bacterium]|nr:hypothetical protein [Candidatus Limnocylindrales bacterium]
MSRPLGDPVAEAQGIVEAATARGLTLRIVGGVAVALRAPSIARVSPERTYHDIDLAGRGGRSADVARLLGDLGYAAAERFNKLNGAERLLFHAPDGRRLDVFFDRLRMCHELPFRARLETEPLTLPLADLLLSKLQIVELTERDEQDILALLADHPLAASDDGGIATPRLAAVCAADWGWWRTVDLNLERLTARWSAAALAEPATLSETRLRALQRADELRQELAAAPKSAAWRLRAAVGERLRWYELPEEPR